MSAPLANGADRSLRELEALSGARALRDLSGNQLLMERAHLTGARFEDGRSAGGTCRFLQTADVAIALNLPRASDWELIPAWLEVEPNGWCWERLTAEVKTRDACTLIDRARVLGLAATGSTTPPIAPANIEPPGWCKPSTGHPTVVDLSALWAGPLCGHLLHLCGADVIKVESTHRPDGARFGNSVFYGLLNQGKRSVALNLRNPAGQRALRELLASADIVIESSRPRALRQMGIDAEEMLRQKPDLTWISITGYGRNEPEANWIAFGDDAGVAAGLSHVMKQTTGRHQFAGDAIADPLTGIQAALAAWRGWLAGGGGLISLAMTDVAAKSLSDEFEILGKEAAQRSFANWWTQAQRGAGRGIRARAIVDRVARLGGDTDQVMREWSIRC